jgi:FtsP/CotA-like multicopper oxidase with cupredoxin domain
MKKSLLFALFSTAYLLPLTSRSPERALISDNRKPAGTFRDGVLTLDLEARVTEWHPDSDNGPGVDVQAFAEVGKRAQIPGPVIRVPAGTVVNAAIRNAVPNTTLIVHGLSADSIRVAFNEKQHTSLKLNTPGTYYYWGTTSGRRLGNRLHEDAQLTGAIVVDPRGAAFGSLSRDRILMINMMADTFGSEFRRGDREKLLFVINGRSWPNTERLAYNMSDTIRWRVLNLSVDAHPMHLHGTYYSVETAGDGTRDSTIAAGERPFVNTWSLAPGRTITMSWVPEHPGNWLFHCHIPEHFGARGPLGALPNANEHSGHNIANHALQGMNGLVMGVTVRGERKVTTDYSNRRRIRLVLSSNRSASSDVPLYGFALSDSGGVVTVDSSVRSGPRLILERGKPVGIMVVNESDEPTAIHWHGIELESYFDGVAGFSGIQKRLSPVIAARDSFEARFTPPRAGTFMYHTHVDEDRQQRGGLSGLLLVLEPGQRFDAVKDIPILVSSPSDLDTAVNHVLMNGRLAPSPLELQPGVTYRLRFANITTTRPGLQVAMFRDTVLSRWTPVARDGADLPPSQRVSTPSRYSVTIGRTADFEITPEEPGDMRLEMQTSSGRLLGKIAIHVRR